MPIDETGGLIGDWFSKSNPNLKMVSDIVAAMQSGASSQEQVSGDTRALIGEFVGLIGPLLGEYQAERIIREF